MVQVLRAGKRWFGDLRDSVFLLRMAIHEFRCQSKYMLRSEMVLGKCESESVSWILRHLLTYAVISFLRSLAR